MRRRKSMREPKDRLIAALDDLGYPAEFGLVLAAELKSDNAIERMAGYVANARPNSMEEIVDEMLAIRDLNMRWRERKISEHAEAKLTEFYNRPRVDEDFE
jgi:hypothetical protein